MKPHVRPQNRGRQRRAPSIALFPFLAVLICTMGALVPLLLGIARQARLQARALAQEKAAKQHLDFQAETEAAAWRTEQLKASREATAEQVKAARYKLGHLEDHARRLRQQATELEAAWKQLENADSQTNRQRSDLDAEYGHVQRQLAQAERDLADARQAAASRQPSYAVVPYEGPNHTRRRPIYVECRGDSVILQPEGARLTPEDFLGPMGPGNPLASLLRAVREYWLTNGGFDPQKEGEPYPLLLVRPSGSTAYYAAREAMASWGNEFGYELIDEDWKVEYPPADARLQMILDRALAAARIQQERLIAAAPRKYSKQKPVYRVSPGTGGVQRESGGDDRVASYVPARPSGSVGRAERSVGSGQWSEDGSGQWSEGSGQWSGEGSSGGGRGSRQRSGGSGQWSGEGSGQGSGFGGQGSGSGGRGGATGGAGGSQGPTEAQNLAAVYGGLASGVSQGSGEGSGFGGQGSAVQGSAVQGSAVQGSAVQGSGVQGARVAGSAPPAQGGVAKAPDGYVAGRPRDQDMTTTPVKPPLPGQQVGMPLRPGEWYEPPPRVERPPEPANEKERQKEKKRLEQVAKNRGCDWGLKNPAASATPVSRTIHVDCYHDQLVLSPERGGRVIALRGATDASLDELIAGVWGEMESWGIAGKGMYWRPILRFQVAPGGEQRFQDLQTLLERSGLAVENR